MCLATLPCVGVVFNSGETTSTRDVVSSAFHLDWGSGMVPNGDLFDWFVADGGCVWKPTELGIDLLRPALDTLEGADYFPLRDEPALFRKFAELGDDPEGILKFAGKYGRLVGLGTERRVPGHGETLKYWRTEVRVLNSAVEIAQACRGKATAANAAKVTLALARSPELRECLAVRPASLIECDDPERFSDLWAQAPHKTQTTAAFTAVRELLRRRLATWVEVRLIGRRDLSLTALPVSLIGAIWLQFGSSLTQRVSYRQCEECREYIEISRRVTGSTRARKFCSSRCRLRTHRRKQPKQGSSVGTEKAVGIRGLGRAERRERGGQVQDRTDKR